MTTTAPSPAVAAPRIAVGRRIALGVTTVLAAVLPTSWGLTSAGDLLTGTDPRARFYQLTGQGVLIAALWLGGLVPLVVAGWRRRSPSIAAALTHLAVGIGIVVAGALAPGNGGAVLAVIVVLTGALLWAALPVRPELRLAFARLDLDPLLTPVGLLVAALLTPYAISEASRQRTRHDEIATASHYLDMSWLSVTVVALALFAAVLVAARPLVWPTAVSLLVLGAAGLGFEHGAVLPAPALALGIALVLTAAVRRLRPARASRSIS